MAGRGITPGFGAAKKATTRSSKADLQFPVGRIARFLKAEKYAGVSVLVPLFTLLPSSNTMLLRCLNWLEMRQGTTRRQGYFQRKYSWL
ncbi:histone h2a.6 [Nicotiana attenuata]|uniref:Histone h2a.6 n=1 Tax=Nicotiana attenuata TaxID=49451 RepID=A0A314LHM1_NICAT|nr:histone h2a.6 [Nicotiana attenuata]